MSNVHNFHNAQHYENKHLKGIVLKYMYTFKGLIKGRKDSVSWSSPTPLLEQDH